MFCPVKAGQMFGVGVSVLTWVCYVTLLVVTLVCTFLRQYFSLLRSERDRLCFTMYVIVIPHTDHKFAALPTLSRLGFYEYDSSK